MIVDFRIDIAPDVGTLITAAFEDEIAEAIRERGEKLAEKAPGAMRRLMPRGGPGRRSERGGAPFRQTGNLAESIEAEFEPPDTLRVSMLDYGGFLEPLFKDQAFKGAGALDRPFILEGVESV